MMIICKISPDFCNKSESVCSKNNKHNRIPKNIAQRIAIIYVYLKISLCTYYLLFANSHKHGCAFLFSPGAPYKVINCEHLLIINNMHRSICLSFILIGKLLLKTTTPVIANNNNSIRA